VRLSEKGRNDGQHLTPRASVDAMKLNLGCGFDHRAGYLNVDMHPFTNPDLVADVLDLSMLPAATYDEIIAQDVLEHFRWCDTLGRF
jgi:predicted SAM-dependent methyltransferase